MEKDTVYTVKIFIDWLYSGRVIITEDNDKVLAEIWQVVDRLCSEEYGNDFIDAVRAHDAKNDSFSPDDLSDLSVTVTASKGHNSRHTCLSRPFMCSCHSRVKDRESCSKRYRMLWTNGSTNLSYCATSPKRVWSFTGRNTQIQLNGKGVNSTCIVEEAGVPPWASHLSNRRDLDTICSLEGSGGQKVWQVHHRKLQLGQPTVRKSAARPMKHSRRVRTTRIAPDKHDD